MSNLFFILHFENQTSDMKKFYSILALLCCNAAIAQLTTVKSNFGDPQGAGIGNRVVFVNALNGQLGSNDGSAAGTVDIPSSTVVLYGQNAAQLGSKIIFIGFNLATGDELWSSDGTIAGTTMIKDINTTAGTGSTVQGSQEGFTVVGGNMYFTAIDGVNGRELWKTDGTTGGTVMVKDITAGSGSSVIGFPFNMNPVGSTMYFTVNGNQLWKSDGTSGGTSMLKDFSAGGATPISSMFVSNGTYTFFVANDGTNGWELWRTDGTIAGTIMLANIGAGNANGFTINAGNFWDWNFHVFNNMVYFQPNGASISGSKMYKTDGTVANTALLIDFNPSGGGYMDLQNAMDWGNSFFFSAMGELYKSDGTLAGTGLFKDVNPGVSSSNPILLPPRDNFSSGYTPGLFAGGRFFFIADDGTNGKELWVSDGTVAGTMLVKNINATGNAFSGSNDRYFYTKYKFYFGADNGTNGIEPWETDGTTGGTAMIQDVYAGPNSSNPDFFGVANANSKMLFRATDAGGNNIYFLNSTVVPFPLSLTNFTAELKNERTELKWTTQHEVNFSHFSLQRSISGTDFTTIGKVEGKGGTSTNNYSYTDATLTKAGTYYYRLALTDKDGKITYSNIVSVKFRQGFSINLVPTRNEVNVTVNDVNGVVMVRLTDMNGKVYAQQKQKVVAGETIKLPVGNLASGIYIVSVEYDGMIKTERFFK